MNSMAPDLKPEAGSGDGGPHWVHRENSASGPQTRCPGKDQTPERPQGLGTVLLIGLFEVEVIVTVSPIKKQRRGRGEAGGEGGGVQQLREPAVNSTWLWFLCN